MLMMGVCSGRIDSARGKGQGSGCVCGPVKRVSEARTGGVESTETKPSGQKHAIFQSKLPGIARNRDNSRQFVAIRLILSQNLLSKHNNQSFVMGSLELNHPDSMLE